MNGKPVRWFVFQSLKGILPDKYVNNLAKFVYSMSLLLTNSIIKEDLAPANQLFEQFAKKAVELHGKEEK
jgi:hypothetical protein